MLLRNVAIASVLSIASLGRGAASAAVPEPSDAPTDQTAYGAAAVGCINDSGTDAREARAIDAVGWTFVLDCTTGSVSFALSAADPWPIADVRSFLLFIDVDANQSTGCGLTGSEYAFGFGAGSGSTGYARCEGGAWSTVRPGVTLQLGPGATAWISMVVPELVGFRGSLKWFAGIQGNAETVPDIVPDGGIATSSVGAQLPSANCDYPRWQDAQIAAERGASLPTDADRVVCSVLAQAPVDHPLPRTGAGYVMVESTGTVFGFGDMMPLRPMIVDPVVSISAGPGGGYWTVSSGGSVQSRAEPSYGSVDRTLLQNGERPSTISGLPDASGYYVFTDRGRVFAFGAAQHYGDMSGTTLNGSVIASAVTPSGKGYWLVGSDGGIFSFGDAQFYGSTGDLKLNKPVVGIVPDPDGVGYWLVASDGGIFSFSAAFKGSLGAIALNKPIIGALAYGDGYLMVSSDGGIFASDGRNSFTSKPFLGSLGGNPPSNPIVGVAVRPS